MSNEEDRHRRTAEARERLSGRALARLGGRMMGPAADGWEIMGLSVRKPRDETEDFLITLRALTSEGQPVVAFSGGAFLEDAVVTLMNRLSNGSLKWRPDEYGR